MASQSSVLSWPEVPSTPFVAAELRRIPRTARYGIRKLGLSEDLVQELHLAYYQSISSDSSKISSERALHAAGERFRYREVVRRAKREVPEYLAGAAYHALLYGTVPESDQESDL